jgi:NADH:ubiquinone oxidoreductase subunit F (NADH-binding)/Pyruvate/2-oxoacid:ferredoxin oxidoreductase delta subunit/(2Fe-2S) ferredoxin
MHKIAIGMGTCGLASGAEGVKVAAESWAEAHGIGLEIVPTGCLGFCQAEPIMDVFTENGHRLSFGSVKPEETGFILDEILVRKHHTLDGLLGQHVNGVTALPDVPLVSDHPFFKKQVKFVLRNCGVVNPESLDEYREQGGFKGLQRALELGPDGVIEEMMESGLRGRGGGGFPTGKKWQLAAAEKSDAKYVICNADEGDPGAFMDRSLLEGDPFSIIEGMMVAAYAIGADRGIVYCRAEYPLAIERLNRAIETLKADGLLEQPIGESTFSFTLKIKMGAGAFVCGEETALIASIEGKRGMPRPRPPYPAASGVFGYPTVINNVETYANVPHILRDGSSVLSGIGTETSKGTKVFALTGKIRNTGLVEVPMGISLREIIYDIGGGILGDREFKAVQTGGPSGGCIPREHLDIKIDYESLKTINAMMGSGGIVVMDEDTCMVDVAKYFLSFTTNESCGKCIPCREGTQRMYEILESITTPYSKMEREEDNLLRFNMVMKLENLAAVIKETSLCGLGQTSPNPVLSTLRFFRSEYDAHIYDRKCPAAECKGLLTYTIDTDICKGCTLCMKHCPTGAIVGEAKKTHYVVDEKCIRCGKCLETCRFDAVMVS